MTKNFVKTIVAAVMMSAVVLNANAQNVTKVEVNGKTADVVYTDGSKTRFVERNSADLTFEENLAILRGERYAANVKHTGLDREARKRTTLSVLGGAALVNKSMAPQVTAGISHSFFPNWDFGLQAEYSRAKYDKEAIANGFYDTFSMYATFEMVVAQSNMARLTANGTRFKIGGALGAAYQQTDDLSVEKIAGSSGYGFSGKLFIKLEANLSGDWYFLGEGGAKMLPQFDLNSLKTGEEKLGENVAPYVQIGFAYRF